jgi:hypothetical protein
MNHLSTSDAVSADGRRLEESTGQSSIDQYLRPDTRASTTSPPKSQACQTRRSREPHSALATSSATATRPTGRHHNHDPTAHPPTPDPCLSGGRDGTGHAHDGLWIRRTQRER